MCFLSGGPFFLDVLLFGVLSTQVCIYLSELLVGFGLIECKLLSIRWPLHLRVNHL